jgi:hypothetical protein
MRIVVRQWHYAGGTVNAMPNSLPRFVPRAPGSERNRGIAKLGLPRGSTDEVALRQIDAKLGKQGERLCVLNILGDRQHAGFRTDFCDHSNHLLVDRVVEDVLHEYAVDLDVVELQFLQVTE